jgi:hypothetical protein
MGIETDWFTWDECVWPWITPINLTGPVQRNAGTPLAPRCSVPVGEVVANSANTLTIGFLSVEILITLFSGIQLVRVIRSVEAPEKWYQHYQTQLYIRHFFWCFFFFIFFLDPANVFVRINPHLFGIINFFSLVPYLSIGWSIVYNWLKTLFELSGANTRLLRRIYLIAHIQMIPVGILRCWVTDNVVFHSIKVMIWTLEIVIFAVLNMWSGTQILWLVRSQRVASSKDKDSPVKRLLVCVFVASGMAFLYSSVTLYMNISQLVENLGPVRAFENPRPISRDLIISSFIAGTMSGTIIQILQIGFLIAFRKVKVKAKTTQGKS